MGMISETSVSVVVPTYNGVKRSHFLLETVKRNDPSAFSLAKWHVVEDPCGYEGIADLYDEIMKYYPVRMHHLSEWSNMHGAAQKAFQIAFDIDDPDWVIYLGDDLAVTPGALSNMVYFLQENALETVSLVQFPYWNAADLCKTEETEWPGAPELFWTRADFYKNIDWTDKLIPNPHWDNPDHVEGVPPGTAVPYVNVNGCGFACRSETYKKVGGFADGTWCLDESISLRTWTRSDQSIVCLSGPPLVHYFGASTLASPPKHDMNSEARWIEATGLTKAQTDVVSREKMYERQPAVLEEMARCKYYGR